MLKKAIHIYRPLLFAVAMTTLFVMSMIVFGQTGQSQAIVLAAGSDAGAVTQAAAEGGYQTFTAMLGLVTQIAIAVMFLVALIWFVWRGKTNEQLKEMVAGWKDTAERARLKNAELEAENIKQAIRVKEFEEKQKEDRKKYLRLVAKSAGEDPDTLEDEI